MLHDNLNKKQKYHFPPHNFTSSHPLIISGKGIHTQSITNLLASAPHTYQLASLTPAKISSRRGEDNEQFTPHPPIIIPIMPLFDFIRDHALPVLANYQLLLLCGTRELVGPEGRLIRAMFSRRRGTGGRRG
jgi:hypothetical protein